MEVRFVIEHLSRLIRLLCIGQLFASISTVLVAGKEKDFKIKGQSEVYGALGKRIDMVYHLYYKDEKLKNSDYLPKEITFSIINKKEPNDMARVWLLTVNSASDIKKEYNLKNFIDNKPEVAKKLGVDRFEGETEVNFAAPDAVTFSIKSMELNDTSFMFYVKVDFDTMYDVSTTTSLALAEKPVIHESTDFPSKTVNEGKPLDILCKATGKPAPLVKWLKSISENKEEQITESYSQASLQITSVQRGKEGMRQDTGMYICQAENVAGTVRKDIGVTVAYLEYITAGNSMVTLERAENEQLLQPCRIIGYPEPTYKWMSPGGSTISTGKKLVTRISASDYGNYTCTATNQQRSLSFVVEVIKKQGDSNNNVGTPSSQSRDGKINQSYRTCAGQLVLYLATILGVVLAICS